METPPNLQTVAAELRNQIYAHVIASTDHVTINSKAAVVPHALACTSRKLRAEFLPMIQKLDFAKISRVTVSTRDWDLNKASLLVANIEGSLGQLDLPTRQIHVRVLLTGTTQRNIGMLKNWLYERVWNHHFPQQYLSITYDITFAVDLQDTGVEGDMRAFLGSDMRLFRKCEGFIATRREEVIMAFERAVKLHNKEFAARRTTNAAERTPARRTVRRAALETARKIKVRRTRA